MTDEQQIMAWAAARLDPAPLQTTRVETMTGDLMTWAKARQHYRLAFAVDNKLFKRALCHVDGVRWHRRGGYMTVQGVRLRTDADDLESMLA